MAANAQIFKRLTNYKNPKSLGSRLRAKRAMLLQELIVKIYSERGKISILDIGGRQVYWNILPREFLDKHVEKITLLNLPGELQKDTDDILFEHVAGDACNMLEFNDATYDLGHSNSVIEHVGGWDNMSRYASEARRVCKNLFIQTPYFWFPVEPHYVAPLFHWLPFPIRVALVNHFAIGTRNRMDNLDEAVRLVEQDPVLLEKKRYAHLFPDCIIVFEWFLLLPKSMLAIRHSPSRPA